MLKTLLMVITIVLTPAAPKVPVVKRGNAPGDYLFINPLKQAIRFYVNCGTEWELVVVDAKAHEAVYQRIEEPGTDKSNPYCFLDRYEVR